MKVKKEYNALAYFIMVTIISCIILFNNSMIVLAAEEEIVDGDIYTEEIEQFSGRVDYLFYTNINDEKLKHHTKRKYLDKDTLKNITIIVEGLEFYITPQTQIVNLDGNKNVDNILPKVGELVSFFHHHNKIIQLNINDDEERSILKLKQNKKHNSVKNKSIIFENGVYKY